MRGAPTAGIESRGPIGLAVATIMAVGGLVLRHVGHDAARRGQVTSGGGPLDHRPGRRLGRPPRRLERPAQDRRRPAPDGDDRDAGRVRRHRAGRRSRSGGSDGGRPLPIEGVALGLASGVVEAAYFVFLAAAYRRGDLSVVYPIARGTAPLLAVAHRRRRSSASGWASPGRSASSCLIAGFLVAPAAVAGARGGPPAAPAGAAPVGAGQRRSCSRSRPA